MNTRSSGRIPSGEVWADRVAAAVPVYAAAATLATLGMLGLAAASARAATKLAGNVADRLAKSPR